MFFYGHLWKIKENNEREPKFDALVASRADSLFTPLLFNFKRRDWSLDNSDNMIAKFSCLKP